MYAKPYLTDYNNTEPYYIPKVRLSRPFIISTSVAGGNEITLLYNKVILGHDGYTLSATNGPVIMTYVTGDLTTAQTFSLSRTTDLSESIYLFYTPGNVVDELGFPLQAFSNMLVQVGSGIFVHAYKFNDLRNSMYIGVM